MNKIEITKEKLRNLFPAADVVVMSETVSTNADAREIAKAGLARPLLVLAEAQSGGRGRQGKVFHSPRGGLYMTLALPCGLPLTDTVGVTSCAAVAVARAVEKTSGAPCGIKWVNDIYLCGGKLCGILVESVNDYAKMTSEILLIGVGVNLTAAPAVTDSDVKAVSLAECGYPCDRDELCAAITSELLEVRERAFDFAQYSHEYREKSIALGHEVTFMQNGVTFSGQAVGITDSGALTVNCGSRIMTLDSGEIHLRVSFAGDTEVSHTVV